MRPQIQRLRADIACFQEVHGQERPGQSRALLAREQLLAGSNLDGATLVSTLGSDGVVDILRNLVVATHLPVLDRAQLLNTLVDPPCTSGSSPSHPIRPIQIGLERPILHVQLDVAGTPLHVIVVHLNPRSPPTSRARNSTPSPRTPRRDGRKVSSSRR